MLDVVARWRAWQRELLIVGEAQPELTEAGDAAVSFCRDPSMASDAAWRDRHCRGPGMVPEPRTLECVFAVSEREWRSGKCRARFSWTSSVRCAKVRSALAEGRA